MKKFINEFKKFALRGNVIDLAVGVIIGAAFQKIVTSLVDDIISPLIGIFTKTDFSDKAITIGENVSIRYGAFITTVINFIIMTFIIFVFIRTMNKISFIREQNEKQKPRKCPYCFSEIDKKAVRCPHCTSILDESLDNTNEKTPEL